jgi:glyoxylase-like metal-dependent hydrolase (beta-lactamase superfamily II)
LIGQDAAPRPDALRQYGPGLYGWGRFQPRWSFDFNGHALVCDDADAGHVLVVDPPALLPAELDALRALGTRFTVLLLNADHERDSAAIAAALGAPVLAPAADVSLLRQTAVQSVNAGSPLPGGFTLIALSDQKTPGELALHHAGRRVLVLGDAIVGDPIRGLRFVPAMKIADHDAARRAVAALLDLDFDTLLLSDGFCLPQGGKAALAAALPGIAPFKPPPV